MRVLLLIATLLVCAQGFLFVAASVASQRSLKDVGDVATEGFAAYAKYGDDAAESLDELFQVLEAHGDDLGRQAAASIGEAVEKSYKTDWNGAGVPPVGKQRVDEAIAAGRHSYDSHLRALVTPYIGSNQAFKSMEEFEALRFMRAESLREDQVNAIIAIRNSVIDLGPNTEVSKVLSLTDAMGRLQNNGADLTGFFTRKQDLAGANAAGDVIARVRPEYSTSPFTSGEAFAILETKGPNIVSNAQIPRNPGFGGDYVAHYPYTGNGFAASLDGHLTPEWRIPGPAGVQMQPDVTTIAFKNSDGSSKMIEVGALQGHTWILRANGDDLFWEPLN